MGSHWHSLLNENTKWEVSFSSISRHYFYPLFKHDYLSKICAYMAVYDQVWEACFKELFPVWWTSSTKTYTFLHPYGWLSSSPIDHCAIDRHCTPQGKSALSFSALNWESLLPCEETVQYLTAVLPDLHFLRTEFNCRCDSHDRLNLQIVSVSCTGNGYRRHQYRTCYSLCGDCNTCCNLQLQTH